MLSVSRVSVEICIWKKLKKEYPKLGIALVLKKVLKNSQIYKVKWKVGSKWKWADRVCSNNSLRCCVTRKCSPIYHCAFLNFKRVSLSLNFKFLPWQRIYSEFMECKAPAEKGDNVCVKERLKCSLCQKWSDWNENGVMPSSQPIVDKYVGMAQIK